MRVIAKAPLPDFWTSHADAEDPLKAWPADAEKRSGNRRMRLQRTMPTSAFSATAASASTSKGNCSRLIVKVLYQAQIIYIKFIGTHAEYDKVNAEEVSLY